MMGKERHRKTFQQRQQLQKVMAAPSRPSTQLTESDVSRLSTITTLGQRSRRQSGVSSIPGLDLSVLRESNKLVKQARRSIRESHKVRCDIPRSSRIFHEITTSDVDMDPHTDFAMMPLTMRSPSCDIHRGKRVALSHRLPPPPAVKTSSRKPIRAQTHRVHAKDSSKTNASVTRMKQNHDVILNLLDCRKMEELRSAFLEKDHELDLKEFVEVLWQYINVPEGDEARVIHALTELFEDIDINDDKKMQWSEFSDFLAASERHARDSELELEKYEVDLMKKPFRFNLEGESEIQQLTYSKMYDLIALLMANSKVVTIFDHQRNEIVNRVSGHSNNIVSCAFLDGFHGIPFAGRGRLSKQKKRDDHEDGNGKDHPNKDIHIIMATSGLDEVIVIWMVKYGRPPVRLRTINVNCVHITMYWSTKRKLFVTADMKHNLYIWNSKIKDIAWQNKYHKDTIVDILLPHKTSIILTASLDATVVAYDLTSDRVKFRVKVHKRGVENIFVLSGHNDKNECFTFDIMQLISMAYITSLHILVTAAAEHKIRVCDGVVGCPLTSLQGHTTPVVSMVAVPGSPAVISLDSGNTFKLWDIRKMECIQSMAFSYPLHHISAMLSLDQCNKIALVSGGTGGMHYLSRRHADIQAADSSSIVSVDPLSHDPVTGMFLLSSKTQVLTVHESVMKKWDLATGNMDKLIRLLPGQLNKSHTISCCSVSDTKKLLLVGTSRGLVAVISIYSGGLVLKCQPKHNRTVVFTGIFKKMIVSMDSHGALQKYDGFQKSFYSAHHVSNDILLRSKVIQIPLDWTNAKRSSQYTIARVHKKFGILVAASDTGTMRFVCLSNDKVILEQHSLKDEVTSILLKEEQCQMFTADKSGNICCWRLPSRYPARKPFYCVALWRVQNMDSKNQPLSTFCMQSMDDFVITGDGKGLVKVWQMAAKEITETQKRRGSIADEMQLFRLTELGIEEFECKLLMTFPVSKDWLHHLLLVTNKDLNASRVQTQDNGNDDDDNDDEESSDDPRDRKVLCLISASLDGELFAWKLTGSCLGELAVNSRRRRKQWKVRIDVDEMERKWLKHATKLFNKFEL